MRSLRIRPAPTRNFALLAAFLVPIGLLHAFILAEIGIGIVDVLFLLETIRAGSWRACAKPWFITAIAWWLWLLICSLPLPSLGLHAAGWYTAFAFALVIIRFLVFALALQTWLLATPKLRKALWIVIALSCLWIGVESWQQYLTGHNIFGNRRWADGALTGPFWKPRAGDLFGHLLFAALVPVNIWLLARKSRAGTIAVYALTITGAVTAVLIGQRMGTAYALLGGVAAAALLPRLRLPVLAATIAAAAFLLTTPIISAPTHAKLVGETTTNLTNFSRSPYGELFSRAATMGISRPILGYGYNGFRVFCADPKFDPGVPALHIPPTSPADNACNLHPHNYYLQSFEEAGTPGFILFTLMNCLFLLPLLRSGFKTKNPYVIGLFTGVLTYAWPIASTDAFPTLYEPGWFFLLIGLGLAMADRQTTSNAP
jgi:O-antigen ligase